MQATVSAFDPDRRDGRVLLDDGVELPFPAEALTGTRLRLLRPGQRVTLVRDAAGDVRGVLRPV